MVQGVVSERFCGPTRKILLQLALSETIQYRNRRVDQSISRKVTAVVIGCVATDVSCRYGQDIYGCNLIQQSLIPAAESVFACFGYTEILPYARHGPKLGLSLAEIRSLLALLLLSRDCQMTVASFKRFDKTCFILKVL
jgi:hypothetical protein